MGIERKSSSLIIAHFSSTFQEADYLFNAKNVWYQCRKCIFFGVTSRNTARLCLYENATRDLIHLIHEVIRTLILVICVFMLLVVNLMCVKWNCHIFFKLTVTLGCVYTREIQVNSFLTLMYCRPSNRHLKALPRIHCTEKNFLSVMHAY